VPVSEIVPPTHTEPETLQRKAGNGATYAFVVLFIINFLNYMDRLVLTGASNVMAKELGFGIDGVGYLSSAFIVSFALCAIPLGAWADRTKRKNVIALCVTIWSIITAFTALAGNFLQLLIWRILLGIGEAGYAPASSALLSDYFSRTKRAQIMSWWSVATVGGLMVGIVVGGTVAGLGFGAWRWAFLFTGLPGLLLAFLAWRIREPKRNEADNQTALQDLAAYSAEDVSKRLVIPEKFMGRLRTLLQIKSLLVLCIVSFIFFQITGYQF